jgi:hypothetical protein
MHAKSSSKVHIVLSVLLSFDEIAKYARYDKLGMAITMDLHHAAEIQNLLRRKKAYHEFWYRNKYMDGLFSSQAVRNTLSGRFSFS